MTAVAAVGRDPLGPVRDRLQRFPERTRNMARVAAVLGLVVLAYHYSLLSLFQTLGLETPLAYVGLVPVIALVLAAVRSRTAPPQLPIHDRQLDYIVGVPLLLVALGINLVFPDRLSTMFWVWRIDLFTLPFFVAGAVCTVFGIRMMWRQGLAIAFLFLAWPVPYNLFLLRFLNGFTGLTLSGLKALLHVFRVAQVVPIADGSLFQIVHAGNAFQISVVSACSGVNGMVGFLLVGAAFGVIVKGPRVRKASWLLGGMFLLWSLNLARILFIFWVGRQFGESVAIDVFHPFVGLITFNMGIVSMLLALRPFGLSINGAVWGAAESEAEPGSVARTPVFGAASRVAVPKVGAALLILTLLGATLALGNNDLRSYDLVANALGTPKLASFTEYPATPDGWRAQKADEYDWARPYFGSWSTWLRYVMFPGAGSEVALQSSQAVTADVISTSNLRSFSAYGVEACYRFHGYKLRDIASVNVGGGVTAQALSFYNGKEKQDWTVVYWIWPVRSASTTRYERVVLYIQSSVKTTFPAGSGVGIHGGGGLAGADPVDRKLVGARSFLVEFARSVVKNQTAVRVGTSLPVESNYVPNPRTPILRRGGAAPVSTTPATTTPPAATAATATS